VTYAPDALVQDRLYLLDTYDMHPGEVSSDLDPDEVGIVGDSNHLGGYHCGKDRLVPNDYSAQTKRDKNGLTNAASGIDIGKFSTTGADGETYDWRDLSVWMVAECRKGAADTKDIREIIYTDDGKRVLRWDRENGQDSPPHTGEADDSHLTHTHISKYRDAEKRRLTPLFQRWQEEEVGMAISDADVDKIAEATLAKFLKKQLEIPDEWKALWPDDPGIQDGSIGLVTVWRSGYFHARQGNEEVTGGPVAVQVPSKLDQILAILTQGVPVPGEVNLTAESVAAVSTATADELQERLQE